MLLMIFVFSFIGFLIYLWVYREKILNKKIDSLGLVRSEVEINKSSNYLMDEGVGCSSIYNFGVGLIFIVGFHIPGTFRKKFYLVLSTPDTKNDVGVYGKGHIYREMKFRRSEVILYKKNDFKNNESYGDAISDFEAAEVIEGNAFYYYPIPSMFGTGNLSRIIQSK